jgi:hypothetical protein
MLGLRFFARYLYVPTLILGLNALALYLMAEGYRYVWLGLLILTVIALSFLIERVLPYEEDWNRAHYDVRKDVAHGVVYEIAYVLTLGTLLLISLKLSRWSLWPQWLPIAVSVSARSADCRLRNDFDPLLHRSPMSPFGT